MKRIVRLSIIGAILSVILFVVKSGQTSKILAVCALLVFIFMYFGTNKNRQD